MLEITWLTQLPFIPSPSSPHVRRYAAAHNNSAMPRPKVLDSQRVRAVEACTQCRETKKKCSGMPPCTQCQRRGLARQCFITSLPRGFRSNNNPAAMRLPRTPSSRVSAVPAPMIMDGLSGSSDVSGAQLDQDAAVARNAPFRLLSPSESREENDDSTAIRQETTEGSTANDSSLAAPGPRMLLSSHGERGLYRPAFPTAIFCPVADAVVS
jgi:hypothetical protein